MAQRSGAKKNVPDSPPILSQYIAADLIGGHGVEARDKLAYGWIALRPPQVSHCHTHRSVKKRQIRFSEFVYLKYSSIEFPMQAPLFVMGAATYEGCYG